jgi:hypothetical protein
MAVKRRIRREEIEEILEDTPSPESQTAPPPSLTQREDRTLEPVSRTDVPSRQGDYGEDDIETGPGYSSRSRQPTVGRTWPDMLITFSKEPQLMPVVSLFVSFALCIGRIHKFGDIWLPVLISILMDSVWFGVKAISNRSKVGQQRGTGKR